MDQNKQLKPKLPTCPEKNCGQKEFTHRFKGKVRLSVCGNGHGWNPDENLEKQIQSDEADFYEAKIAYPILDKRRFSFDN